MPFQDPRYNTPEPVSTSIILTPTPMLTIIPFRGSGDFDCKRPMGGDYRFGYCKDALSDGYYVWARCTEPCPEWPFPGVEWRKVGDTSGLRDFIQLIEDRDDALAASAEARRSGTRSARLDLTIAALGWESAKCIVGGELTLGASCIAFVLGVLAAGGAAIKGFTDSSEARSEADEIGQEARGIFEELQP